MRGLQGSLRGYQRISKLSGRQSGRQILGMVCSYRVLRFGDFLSFVFVALALSNWLVVR